MALAHERLFESGELARIDLGGYIRSLWDALTEIYGADKAKASFDLMEIRAGTAEAVPFGLFATEALSNAIRHGAGPSGALDATICLRALEDGNLEFSIRDDGPGLPAGAVGLGLRLMDALAAQLKGTAERHKDGGTVVLLRFPAPGADDA